jgi:amino acid adenylation domain-containing protein
MKLNSLIYQEMGVNLDITSLFTDPTIKNLADSIDNHIETVDVDEVIDLAKDMDYFPLTANQLGIYYECMQSPNEVKYTLPICIRFGSNIDPEKLKQAIVTTIESHPYLKTRIINTDDGELKQKRCDDIAIDEIEIVEVDEASDEDLMNENVRAFNLTKDQLFRFKIYKTPEETVLFSDFHHIITDGVSQDNIFTDITKAYNGESIEKEKIDGYAYSLIEEANSENEVSKKYFHNKLTQGIESTVLTPDLNGNPDIGEIKLVEENVNSTFVKHFCKDHAISPNVLFMTTAVLALNKFTFSDKSLITTIFNGRANSDYFNTQGMLVKTIPIIINGENREMMVEDFIKVVDKSWKESLIHSSYPYTKLAEEYQLKPEFFYAFHEFFQSEEFTIEDEDYTMDALDGTIATDYKVNLNVFDDGEEVNLVLEYNDQLYSEEYAQKFLQAMKFILVQFFVNDMDKYRICDVKLKEDFGLHEFSEVELPFIHKRFERQVAETPNGTALIASDATLTYNELNQKANRVANALIDLGIKPNSNVLIMLPRTSNLISAILGVLKAGCTFIPIDIEYPKGRIDYIFENSQADYIIADGTIENSIDVAELLEFENVSNPHVEISPDDLAYMIYTSGSTGAPKGVMTSHKNITNLFSKSEDSVIYDVYSKMHKTLALSTVSFDAFLLDFMPLTFGLEMVLANDSEIKSINELTDLVRREKPDSLTFTAPSRFKQYLEFDEFAKLVPNFKYIGVGGEMVPQDLVAELLENPDLEVFNIYGPTETTVTCNTHKIDDAENITVGKALHNCITEVRDIDGKLLPSGIMGELYIGGNGVARGYYNMEDKTKEAFITINDIPYYKSGDYAIELPNGELVIKGRIDNQIKLRGLRIEIGEIESNISNYPNIKQNVVLIKEINNNEHLCAYFTAEEKIDTEDLKEYLTQYLTRYMVPTVFMQLDEMPISPNGKTDIKQLPEPKLDLEYVAPENELEQLICAIFSSTLGIETVGAEDNFFEIGGTSLVASKIILELLKRDYTVKYDDVFTNQTPRQLARFLSGEHEVEDDDYDIADDYDYSKINNLLSENTLENFYDGEKQEIGNLLLTGVTGYLGIHVLYDYIKNEKGTVYCMLRKGGFDSCEDRLADLFDYYFDGELTDLIGSRIILSEGDITELDDFKKLEEYPIDTLINCAAIVKHYTADDYIFKVNVDGVINGIKYAQVNNVRYVQVSTMSVLSYPEDTEFARDVQLDERTLYYRQDLTNKYVNSKFLAERMLLEAAVDGLDVKIVRVGNLMSRYRDGLFQKNYDTNAFLANIKSIKNIQAISSSMYNEAEEMSPIDCTAKAIIALSKTPQKCRVFNCQNKNELLNSDIINVLNSFGYDIREVSDDEFMEICRENMDENIQGLITSDMSMADEEAYEEDDYEYILKTDQTVEILESLGFEWVKPDADYLTRAIDYLNNLGFFN